MSENICLVCHRKSANEPYVKEAVKAVRKQGIDLRVLVPFNKAEKPRVVAEAIDRGATRIIAGGGFNVAPNAKLDDGLLDLVEVGLDPGEPALNVKRELDDITNPDNKHVGYMQLSEFTIEADRKMHCNLDGEPILRKKFRFGVLPRHLRVVF